MDEMKNLPMFRLLRKMNGRYPGLLDALRSLTPDEKKAVTRKAVADRLKIPSIFLSVSAGMEEVDLSMLFGWRLFKNVYDFDPSLSEELYRQAEEPVSVSRSCLDLPYPVTYIRTHVENADFSEFAVWKSRQEDGTESLTIRSFDDMENPFLFPLLLGTSEEPLEDAIRRSVRCAYERADAVVRQSSSVTEQKLSDSEILFRRDISFVVTAVLYLNAVNAEVRRDPLRDFRRTRIVRDIPRELERFSVGEETGIRIRKLYGLRHGERKRSGERNGSRRSPVPHLRRAHWHTYLFGSHALPKEKRRPVLKWLSPVMVGGPGGPLLTVTKVYS